MAFLVWKAWQSRSARPHGTHWKFLVFYRPSSHMITSEPLNIYINHTHARKHSLLLKSEAISRPVIADVSGNERKYYR